MTLLTAAERLARAQQVAREDGGWVTTCAICDDPTVIDEPGTALCSDDCTETWRALQARYAAPAVCPKCDRPGGPCPERADGGCAHCDAPVGTHILDHYHPYRSTND